MTKSTFILILGLFCLAAGPLAAQPMFGIRGGFNSSWYTGEGTNSTINDPLGGKYDTKQTGIIRPDMGIFLLMPLIRNMLAFQLGVDYYGAGTFEKVTAQTILGTLTSENTLKLNYVSLPVLLRFAYAREDMRLYALGGGYVAYAMSGRQKVVSTLTTEEDDVDFGIHGITHLDYGAVLGLGAMFRTGPVWLGAELRYRKGLCNLNRNTNPDEGPTNEDYAPMTNTLSPTIVLHIPLGKEKY